MKTGAGWLGYMQLTEAPPKGWEAQRRYFTTVQPFSLGIVLILVLVLDGEQPPTACARGRHDFFCRPQEDVSSHAMFFYSACIQIVYFLDQ